MYNTFFRYFGLRENPFNVNPNPGYLYFITIERAPFSKTWPAPSKPAKASSFLRAKRAPAKPRLINRLKQWLEKQRIPTAFIFNPHLEVNELFDLMLADFGISADAHLKGSSLGRLNQWFVDSAIVPVTMRCSFWTRRKACPPMSLKQIRLLLNHELAMKSSCKSSFRPARTGR